jgi:uncharacterized ParB-like nuclease family protein
MKNKKQIEIETELSTDYLSEIQEYDREGDGAINCFWGKNSETRIKEIVADIDAGIGIKEPVEVIVYNKKAFMSQGCHRVAAAKRRKVSFLKAIVYFILGKLPEHLEEYKDKFK